MQKRFAIMDVFAEQPMSGNQLGVVYDSDGLDTGQMQAIAREFNFSETVFLGAAKGAGHSASMRIFTPNSELPFAGHPTVGAAIAIASDNGMESAGQGIVVIEEGVGPVRCGVRFEGGRSYAEFDLPVIAKQSDPPGSKETASLALGLSTADIGFENHVLSSFDGGLPYELVPVANLEAIRRATPQMEYWVDAFGNHAHNSAYVYCRETVGHENHFHARMFAPAAGIPEDPATGSAVASFAGAVVLFDDLRDGLHIIRVEQGVEMGRPSLITLEIEMADGVMSTGRIGGHAVIFAQGHIDI